MKASNGDFIGLTPTKEHSDFFFSDSIPCVLTEKSSCRIITIFKSQAYLTEHRGSTD